MDPVTRKPATEEQLAKAADISPEDIARARRMWVKDAQPKLKTLLDAEDLPMEPQ